MPEEDVYKPLYYTPVEKFDDRNYCILQCTNPDLNPGLFDYEEDLESYISAYGYKMTEKRPRNCHLKDPKHKENKYLKQSEAETRAANLSNIRYHLSCALVKGGETFLGNVLMMFDLKHKTTDDPNNGSLFIDYKGRAVRTFRVNGVYVLDERVYNS